jgi:tetraacyldisaccharide-1-P 4'-kinase
MPFPSGPMRQMSYICDTVIITDGKMDCGNYFQNTNSFIAKNTPIGVNKNLRYYAFAGVGNPERFFAMLKRYGIDCVKQLSFPDHYKYSVQDVNKIITDANKINARPITTRKDYVKLLELHGDEIKDKCDCCNVLFEVEDELSLLSIVHAKVFD